eukprot:CAMPEP_0202461494 /NCGR_PEP_ID=MMETSP1360-20130828/49641_1 /ASSEMBLY_ACC=CAM_ASM_000848 /TAXON_ID=515479 /ORGANISM="Licmophora paradoxa, Strain CCMP2313" /LENGTH=57 /DNA_ID=CAMNT_0049083565 /DNA_START=35 /DNA_END=205 /DNA_ORIENTATION=-
MKRAFAELILPHYGKTYGHLLDGWWFDQGDYLNIPLVYSILKPYNPNAVFAFNKGPK